MFSRRAEAQAAPELEAADAEMSEGEFPEGG